MDRRESVARDVERRASRTDRLEALFRSRPGAWLPVAELAQVGGFCAWRTRVADVRGRVTRSGAGVIEWNGQTASSAYRYLPYVPLARDGATPIAQRSLF